MTDGQKVEFTYITTGHTLPATPDDATIYFIHDTQEIYVGSRLIGNVNNGTDNYNELINKPSINSVTLTGNKSSEDLGIHCPTWALTASQLTV